MKKTKKPLVMAVSLALVAALGAGATYAWLTDKTDEVKNTFTVGNVDIELAETNTDGNSALENAYKMVPGQDIVKDPKVTVKANSEACWVFVKVTEGNDLDKFITYGTAAGWTALSGQDGVYYREQAATTTDVTYSVLLGDKVTVNGTVTKADMDALTDGTLPTLSFKAYAIQQAGFNTAADAWTELNRA